MYKVCFYILLAHPILKKQVSVHPLASYCMERLSMVKSKLCSAFSAGSTHYLFLPGLLYTHAQTDTVTPAFAHGISVGSVLLTPFGSSGSISHHIREKHVAYQTLSVVFRSYLNKNDQTRTVVTPPQRAAI